MMLDRETVESLRTERDVAAWTSYGEHDAKVALAARATSGSDDALRVELHALTRPSVPRAYAVAFVDVVWRAIFGTRS